MSGQRRSLVEVKNLKKYFIESPSLVSRLIASRAREIRAVDNVSFHIHEGEAFGLIGESGSGKTTTAKLVLRLIEPTGGMVLFDNGRDITALDEKNMRIMRQKMQMIFQDPYESLNPGMRVFNLISEPLLVYKIAPEAEKRRAVIREILETIELRPPEDFMYRYPHELSGGQRQRVAIARALVLKPKFVAADEPTSMLDVSVRAGILDLMLDLKDKLGLTYLFITHDVALARYMCDRIAVMYRGKIVEMGEAEQVIQKPLHPYTRALLTVVSGLQGFWDKIESVIVDKPMDRRGPYAGCRFRFRCPLAQEICVVEEPPLREIEKGHFAACGFA